MEAALSWQTTLTALGGYFAVPSAGPDWQSTAELLKPVTLQKFVTDTRAAMARSAGGDIERIPVRVAASAFHMGVASRVMSPLIGAAVTVRALPRLDGDSLAWRADGHTAIIGHRGPGWVPAGDPIAAATAIAETALPAIFTPLHMGLRTTVALSPQTAWGNVVSAANGAVTVLAMRHPHLAPAGRDLIRALLTTDPLTGTGEFVGAAFRRHNCCLFYRIPGAGLCGDCVLAARTDP